MKGVQTVMFTVLPLLTMTSCTWFGGGYLPLQVTDARTDGAKPTVVDVYAVPTELERERAEATPVDEYFRTLGLPSRPQHVWRAALPSEEAPRLFKAAVPYRTWREDGSAALVALTPAPTRAVENGPEPRRLIFSPRRADYPAGTRSLHLYLTEQGLQLVPSRTKLKPYPHP